MGIWWRQTASHHPVIGWWWIPNLTAIIGQKDLPYLFRTNSLGMRSDREYTINRPSGRHRIVLLGDSYTHGNGVSNGERFSDVLEKSYPDLDVMNFGLGASGTDQQLLVYETFGKAFEADAYIFAPFVNNILRNLSDMHGFGRDPERSEVQYRSKPYFTLDGEQLKLHNLPVPNRMISEREAMKERSQIERWGLGSAMNVSGIPEWLVQSTLVNRVFFTLENPFDGYESESSGPWRLMRAILERFIRQVPGKPVFIMPLPDLRHFLMGLTPTYLERFQGLDNPTMNCFVVDVLQYFNRLPRQDRKKCVCSNDPHYSVEGHRIVAQAISESLAKHRPDLLVGS